AANLEEYVELAVSLASARPRLAELRGRLRQQMASSPLCEGKRLAANLMRLLRGVWRDWLAASNAGSWSWVFYTLRVRYAHPFVRDGEAGSLEGKTHDPDLCCRHSSRCPVLRLGSGMHPIYTRQSRGPATAPGIPRSGLHRRATVLAPHQGRLHSTTRL